MSFFPKEGVGEIFLTEHQLNILYKYLAIKFKSSRKRPYLSGYRNTKSLVSNNFLR